MSFPSIRKRWIWATVLRRAGAQSEAERGAQPGRNGTKSCKAVFQERLETSSMYSEGVNMYKSGLPQKFWWFLVATGSALKRLPMGHGWVWAVCCGRPPNGLPASRHNHTLIKTTAIWLLKESTTVDSVFFQKNHQHDIPDSMVFCFSGWVYSPP